MTIDKMKVIRKVLQLTQVIEVPVTSEFTEVQLTYEGVGALEIAVCGFRETKVTQESVHPVHRQQHIVNCNRRETET